ncbi:iron ABC transporter permease [uncultured Dysosmobacter sp.]|uniref:ABC transporter permease n=1 Tax=uncultured Dysosmobacter sp. TaxID=2591384 RepID=UPI00262DCFA4|nr:iron ABC transporter permease [uncultured Dysosmobacter sp.]
MVKRRPDVWQILSLVILAAFCLFLLWPLLCLFLSGFQGEEGQWTLENFVKFFSKRYYYQALWNSLSVAVCVTALTLLIGIPLAYCTTFFRVRGRGVLDLLIIIAMMSPPFIGAYSWILLCGRSGWVTTFFAEHLGIDIPTVYGFRGIVLVLTLKLYPFIYIYVSGALKRMDPSLMEAAESLGIHGIRKITSNVLPLIAPTALSAALLVFMNALADFGTPQLIGEGYVTMPTLIYTEFVNEMGGNASFAAALAALMVAITAVLFLLQKFYVDRRGYNMNSMRAPAAQPVAGWRGSVLHILLYGVVLFSLIPQVTVIYTSFLNANRMVFLKGYSLNSYVLAFQTLGGAIWNTVRMGSAAIFIIVILGVAIAYLSVRRRNIITGIIDTASMFPYIIPGSVLGITLLLTFNKRPWLWGGTAIIMVLSLVIRRLPYTLRSSSAILHQIPASLEEASVSLGVSPLKSFFRITTVLMLPGVFSGAILSWVTVINELSSSVILYSTKTRTLSVAVYSEVVRGSYGTAAALSTILTVLTLVSLLIAFRVSGNDELHL